MCGQDKEEGVYSKENEADVIASLCWAGTSAVIITFALFPTLRLNYFH